MQQTDFLCLVIHCYINIINHVIPFCILRWPRLPVETSLPLDFGATPVNESKVDNTSGCCIFKMYFWHLCAANWQYLFCVSGEDVHAEESFLFSCFCRDSDPLPLPSSPGGPGPPNQMVHCQQFNIAEIDSTSVVCVSRLFEELLQHFSLVDLSIYFLCFDWQV